MQPFHSRPWTYKSVKASSPVSPGIIFLVFKVVPKEVGFRFRRIDGCGGAVVDDAVSNVPHSRERRVAQR